VDKMGGEGLDRLRRRSLLRVADLSSIDTRVGQGDLGLTREGGWPMVLRKDKVEIGNCAGPCAFLEPQATQVS
jgi:hypothetical protein